ncbi:DNA mismatch repair protein MLH1 [Nakaseomyces bracarensis]|uniref:DNA mismatch repair protein MLH1 n=1 Tax=Nakaseomyces bracarensis TaxID=273131 RepID=A0ABR4NZS2_9SACH
MSRIKALDASVVNKIAAGEIIISPVNVLKEMMENSIDAGATMLDILVRDGGIKLLQISDNGSGIQKEDLPLLCERFATSKLTNFQDLENIATYGFRGEALASISHIARLSVTTKTADEQCAWKVGYKEGEMLENPKPIAGKDGTTILVEDLFYNIPSRLRALRSPNEEYTRILDVVGRYGIHSKGIGLSCKKFGDSNYTITLKPNFSTVDRIRSIYGNNVASNTIAFEMKPNDDLGLIEVNGYISTPNLNAKKSIQPIFFINNRLVTCDPLRRAIYNVYSNYIQKGNRPFIYLNISIHPPSVDVNVHPTKREVRFLNQDEIIDEITMQIHSELSKIDTSRTFKKSIVMPKPISDDTTSGRFSQPQTYSSSQGTSSSQVNPKRYENKLVRIDSSQSKITSFLKSSQYNPAERLSVKPAKPSQDLFVNEDHSENEEIREEMQDEAETSENVAAESIKLSEPTRIISDTGYTVVPKNRVTVNLTSIQNLRNRVDNSAHRELTDIFANSNFIGIVDFNRRLLTMQYDLKLFLVDYGSICNELFYQIGLTDFANFGKIYLEAEDESDTAITKLLEMFDLDQSKSSDILNQIYDMREMLDEYFSVEIVKNSKGEVTIKSIPLLLKGYIPPLSKLPLFLYRLGTTVNWEIEEDCLAGILKQIALFYIPEVILDENTQQDEGMMITNAQKTEQIGNQLEHILFPCIKRRFLAPSSLLTEVLEIANLPGLYKVFERC